MNAESPGFRWGVVGVIVGIAVVLLAAAPNALVRQARRARPTPQPTFRWNEFSADLAMTMQEVDSSGKQVSSSVEPIRMRVRQLKIGRFWKTTLTSLPRPHTFETLTGKRTEWSRPIRIEDNGDGSPVRVYDHDGLEVTARTQRDQFETLRRLAGNGIDVREARQTKFPDEDQAMPGLPFLGNTLVESAEDSGPRRRRIEEIYGASRGSVAGKNRYIRQRSATTSEALVEPSTNLVIEENIARSNRLVMHKTTAYESFSGGFVRKTVRSEHPAKDGSGKRTVFTLEAAGVTLGSKAVR